MPRRSVLPNAMAPSEAHFVLAGGHIKGLYLKLLARRQVRCVSLRCGTPRRPRFVVGAGVAGGFIVDWPVACRAKCNAGVIYLRHFVSSSI